jgi:hypothetical protein
VLASHGEEGVTSAFASPLLFNPQLYSGRLIHISPEVGSATTAKVAAHTRKLYSALSRWSKPPIDQEHRPEPPPQIGNSDHARNARL